MAVYVDSAAVMFKGKPRHHATADTREELHAAAERACINRCWFHKPRTHPHYDVTDGERATLIALGAVATDTRTVLSVAKRLARA